MLDESIFSSEYDNEVIPNKMKRNRESAVEFVLQYIKQQFSSNQLTPGDRIPTENILADEIGVSRTSVREAMKILSAFGIIDIKRGDGTYICKEVKKSFLNPLTFMFLLSKPNAQELIELREMLEIGVMNLIIKNATNDDINKLEQEHLRMKERIQKGEITNKAMAISNYNFHLVMAEATKNELIGKVYGYIMEYFLPTFLEIHKDPKANERTLEIHQHMIDALKEKNVEKAKSATDESVTSWIEGFNI
jgi:DNA-binding FadR family transcriptional regulator